VRHQANRLAASQATASVAVSLTMLRPDKTGRAATLEGADGFEGAGSSAGRLELTPAC
jgi:predicted transcriptional regulator